MQTLGRGDPRKRVPPARARDFPRPDSEPEIPPIHKLPGRGGSLGRDPALMAGYRGPLYMTGIPRFRGGREAQPPE
jgi:hypothetical protein